MTDALSRRARSSPRHDDVSAAVLHVAPRYRNESEAYAAEQGWSARAEARTKRDVAEALGHRLKVRAEGDRRAFVALVAARADRPELTEFRLLWDTLAGAYAGRAKLVLDPRAGGRRHIWLADPEKMGLLKAVAPEAAVPPVTEPVD